MEFPKSRFSPAGTEPLSNLPSAPVVLYAEVDILIQNLLVPALEEAGFTVQIVHSGFQAVSYLASETNPLHGLITDVTLGDGPDGWDIAKMARELTGALPVVYVSAASEHDWTSKGVPNSLMIAKPFVPAQVVVAISSLLNTCSQN